MPRTPTLILALLAPGLMAGSCDGRPPGPSEEERGMVAFWEIATASINFESCTNEPDFEEGFGTVNQLVGTVVSYRLSNDGSQAESLACTTTNPEDCVRLEPPRVFAVDGNRFTYAGEPEDVQVAGLDCEQRVRTDWALVDQGETLDLSIETSFMLTGTATACDELDATFAALSTNNTGIRDCRIVRRAEAELIGFR